MRAVSVPFSPARPSRLKKEPGIFPAAYIRSSTSTVSGRKSTSRWLPAVAVARTTVSPWRTTTDPEACLASLPVSNEISLPLISTETVVAPSFIRLSFLAHPSVGGRVFSFSSVSERAQDTRRSGAFRGVQDRFEVDAAPVGEDRRRVHGARAQGLARLGLDALGHRV